MTYSELVNSEEYPRKHAGAGLEVLIIDEDDPTNIIIGATTGLNMSTDLEVIDIEEAGNEIVDELVQGRATVAGTVQHFWTPEWGDRLPDTQDFLGKSYLVIVRIAPNFPNAGQVVDACTGGRLTRIGKAHGARGARTSDLAFKFMRHFKGSSWAARTGQA